jgi:predicted kinase
MSCMLIAIGGLPGTGKTSLARSLARVLDAVHLRIDTIEQAIRSSVMGADAVGPVGYGVAYAVAEDNLRLGRSVVADCVNPLVTTRAGWAAVAKRTAVALFEVEVICSDPLEHRRRVESRRSDIAALSLPTWDEVMAREYEPWTGDHAVIDTARGPVKESVIELHALLLARERAVR